jgi:hypothetical protein
MVGDGFLGLEASISRGMEWGNLDNDDYYAQLRALAQTLRQAGREVERGLTPALRDETPDWLLERLDGALRAIEMTAGEVGRFIREDRTGAYPAPLEYDNGDAEE